MMLYAMNTPSRMNGLMIFALMMINHISRISGDCCDSIAISSTSVGRTYQEHQLGVYTKVYNLTVNNRPVYKQNKGDQYAYYWVGVICLSFIVGLVSVYRFLMKVVMMTGRTGWCLLTMTTGGMVLSLPT